MKAAVAMLLFTGALLSAPRVWAGPGASPETPVAQAEQVSAAGAEAAPAAVGPAPAASPEAPRGARQALPLALLISGKSLVVIFVVMALFGALIALLGRVFPGTDGELS